MGTAVRLRLQFHMVFRLLSVFFVVLGATFSASACGPAQTNSWSEEAPLGEESPESPVADTAGAQASETPDKPAALEYVDIAVPIIPAISVPDLSAVTAAEVVVAEKLGDLVSPAEGVELLSASCVDEDGEGGLVYSGTSKDSDVFEIREDGSGTYMDQSDEGKVELSVANDGSGRFVDSTNGLLTIEVASDGSGEYYEQSGSSLITIVVNSDGSGEYHNDDRDFLETVSLATDGSGEYYLENDDELITVAVASDGAGEYYRQQKTVGIVTTIQTTVDGGWQLVEAAASQTVTVDVAADGSGSYKTAGLSEAAFRFGADGMELAEPAARQVKIDGVPEFTISANFPNLGKLGSLNPPCATVIRFDSQLLFDFNETELRSEAFEALDDVAEALNTVDGTIEIAGHSDSIGDEETNQELSLERALVVESALRERGVEADLISKGYGETRPVEPNELPDGSDNPSGRNKNRRVEIVIPQ